MDKKTQKYDRQLRLWGSQGQHSLECAKICLLNATVTGTESLKNLILPGIGSFTIVDGTQVTGSDIGSNFFLTIDQIGYSKAKCVTELLMELNEDVEGKYIEKDPVSIINNEPDFFKNFTVVIATNILEKDLIKLGEICKNENIVLISNKTNGFFGSLRIFVPEHTIIESHAINTTDFRLDCPFKSLYDYCMKFDFSNMTPIDHCHIPFVVILIQCLEKYKSKHNGNLPTGYKDRDELKSIIESMRLKRDEENFDEAIASLFRAYRKTTIPSEIQNIFNDEKCLNINSNSTNFWIMANATLQFVRNEGNGLLPHSGVIPDMKADTKKYVDLQTIYHQKHQEDFQNIRMRVNSILESINRPINSVDDDEIIKFIKNSANLNVIRYRSINDEYKTKPNIELINQSLQEENNNMIYYILFRAVDKFYEVTNHYPGVVNEEIENDEVLLTGFTKNILEEYGLESSLIPEDCISEMVRAGWSEIHSTSSFIGGMISQEVLKLVTHQYTPMNNTCIINGISLTTTTYEM